MSRKILITIVVSISLMMFFACTQKNNQVAKVNSVDETTESDKTVSISPIAFFAYGNSYTITKYKIKKNAQGNTTVTAIGYGFDILPFRNGRGVIPVWCAFISDGKEIEANSASQGRTSVEYFFETTAEPATIIFYPADDESKKIEINCK